MFVVFKLMYLFRDFRPIWLATSVFWSLFWLVDKYFWIYFCWLAKSGCQNLILVGNTFPLFPSFWSPASDPGLYGRIGLMIICWGSSNGEQFGCRGLVVRDPQNFIPEKNPILLSETFWIIKIFLIHFPTNSIVIWTYGQNLDTPL